MRWLLILAFAALALIVGQPGLARAGNCSSPTKPEGAIIYSSNYHVAAFCNGTNWVSMYGGMADACSAISGLSFTDLTAQSLSTVIASNTATITFGCGVAQSISVAGTGTPQISINGGAWGTSGTISSGQTLQVRLTSSASVSTMLTATVTIGSSTASWNVTTRPASLKIFVTTGLYIAGTLGGLAGADAACQTEAGTAGYAGTYKAVLSDGSVSAAGRLTLSYPVVNAFNGSTVSAANLWNSLLSTQVLPPSGVMAAYGTWTGTNANGTAQASTCVSWTDTTPSTGVGVANAVNGSWMIFAGANCGLQKYLYCIQQ